MLVIDKSSICQSKLIIRNVIQEKWAKTCILILMGHQFHFKKLESSNLINASSLNFFFKFSFNSINQFWFKHNINASHSQSLDHVWNIFLGFYIVTTAVEPMECMGVTVCSYLKHSGCIAGTSSDLLPTSLEPPRFFRMNPQSVSVCIPILAFSS